MVKTVNLNYVKQGQGPCILICHGLYGSLSNFGGLAKHLEKDYTVIRIDLRNHGKSPHINEITQQSMANDLVRLIDLLGVNKIVVLGHSLGGKVAMIFAQQNPLRVSSLVVVDVAPVDYPLDSHSNVFTALKSVDLLAISSRSEADDILKNRINDISMRQFLLTNLQRTANGYQWRMNLDVLISDYSDIASAPPSAPVFNGPTLLIKGSDSTYINDAMLSSIFQRFPNCVVNTVNDAGHWLHAEKPTEFFKLVKDFLNTIYIK